MLILDLVKSFPVRPASGLATSFLLSLRTLLLGPFGSDSRSKRLSLEGPLLPGSPGMSQRILGVWRSFLV